MGEGGQVLRREAGVTSRRSGAVHRSTSIQNNSGLPQGRQGPGAGKLGSVGGDPPGETTAKWREIMMHPHLPGPLPVAVPDIGFPQNISIGPKTFDSSGFADLSG